MHGQLPYTDPQLHLLEGQAPVLGEARHVRRDEQERGRLGPGEGERVLPEGATGQVTRGGTELHAEEHRPQGLGELPEQPAEARRRIGVELAQVERRRDRGGTLLLRLDHGGQDRPVGLEHPVAPQARADGLERGAARTRVRRDAGGLRHVELGHPGQLLVADAHQRVGVLVGPAVGGHAEGQRACGLVPAVGSTARARPDHLEQVPEQSPHRVVGVAGTEHAHTRML